MGSEVLMNLAIKLLLFFIGMGLGMIGISVALHSTHMVLGVLLVFSGITFMWGSLPSYE